MSANNQLKKIALGMGGSLSLFMGGIMLPMSLFGDMIEGASRWPGILFGSICCIASVFCFIKLFITNRREHKFNKYAALIGNRRSIPITWLADKMNCSKDKAIKNSHEAMS